MKKRIITLLCLSFLLIKASDSFAQAYTSPVKEIYTTVSQQDGTTASLVYLTSSMLKFSMTLASAVSNDEKIDSLLVLVKSMNEIILLGDMPSSVFSDEQVKKLQNSLNKQGYQTMVQMKENGEELNVYMLEDAKSNKIKDLVVIMKERNERMVLSITGEMTAEQLAGVAALANIDIGNFLPR